MTINLKKATIDDEELIYDMQIRSFSSLFKKYNDKETNPGNEPIEKVKARLKETNSYYYLIYWNRIAVGAIRVVMMEDGIEKRISPLFILPEYQNRGIAQKAIREVEIIHGKENWALETALQEKRNCHLYEKMGYKFTGKSQRVNDKLTLVLYAK